MKFASKFILSLFIVFSLVGGFLPATSYAASNPLLDSEEGIEEISIFLDGKLKILDSKSYLAINGSTYVPIKLLTQLPGISIVTKNGVTISTLNGTYKINKSNSYVFNNRTYISFELFLKISNLKGKYVSDVYSLFIWSNEDGETRSKKLINNIASVPKEIRYFMGRKVYVYEGNKIGWVSEMSNTDSSFTDVEIVLQSGKTIEATIFLESPTEFTLYQRIELLNGAYGNRYAWVKKNVISSNIPLYNIEKIYIISLKVDNKKINVTAKRSNGNKFTFSLPFSSYPQEVMYDQFYYSDPRKTHPSWSDKIWKAIQEQQIVTGMNAEQVLMSWGGADRINSHNKSNLRIEQWVYGNTYLYFYNGVLDSWND
ncbi:hypothetical protein J2T13_003230 [Paenibacillus sp. DS2015]|uniref:hypothetical protein n=1 Tax=Paenibacillus sp. DS2015 TaxID=3373917 RepID=UPI003D25A82E